MLKPNWDIFKSKFNDNPQSNFEWMCYMLFCKEFDRTYGIFRYKNQSAIETEPIQIGNDFIGWQAKFYNTTLASNANELINTIVKAKENYPAITQLHIYNNKEWGQHRGSKPQGLKNIEEKAQELEIKLIWKLASFFESPFVCISNEVLLKHFFTYEKSILDLIKEQEKHSQRILEPIQLGINYNGKHIEIDRTPEVEQLLDSEQQVFIISGKAGAGKTVVAKKLYTTLTQDTPFYIFKASEFNNLRTLNDFFKDFNFGTFIDAHQDDALKFIVIDSAEKLLELNNTDPFKEFIYEVTKEKWRIIFTTRDQYLDDLNYQFFSMYNVQPAIININKLKDDDLHELSTKFDFHLPDDLKLLELLRIPFYLSNYFQDYSENKRLTYSNFKAKLWNQNIRCNKPAREICFMRIAQKRAIEGLFYVNPGCESSILNELQSDEILGYDTPGYFIAHDIYEDWALEKIVEKEYHSKTNISDFYAKLGKALPIRRSFRGWLSEKLFLDDNSIYSFIEQSLLSKEVEIFWKDEVIISVLLSDYSSTFFKSYKTRLLDNTQELLRKFALLLRVACKEVDDDLFKQFGLKKNNFMNFEFVFTKPKGEGWKAFVEFVYSEIDSIGIDNVLFTLPVIHEWNGKFREGKTTRQASLIALMYYQWSLKQDRFYYKNSVKEKLLQTILNGSAEIKDELIDIFDQIVSNKWNYSRAPYYDLSEAVLKSFDGFVPAKVIPAKFPKLMMLFWRLPENIKESSYYSSLDIDHYFGLSTNHDFFPASALQTPTFILLQNALRRTVDFILEFTDWAVERYATSGFDGSVKEIDIFISKETTTKQYISNCLWCMYRGTSSPVAPYLLQSIHMALEKYFLQIGEYVDSEILESWLLYMLGNTKSASISSVISSIVMAFPEKTLNVAKLLLKTKEFFIYDTARWIQDKTAGYLSSIGYGLNHNKRIFHEERLETCQNKHRAFALEHICFNYQLLQHSSESENDAKERQKAIWSILDFHYEKLNSNNNDTEEDNTWRMYLARMDYRKMKVKQKETESSYLLEFEPELTPEMKKFSEEAKTEYSETTRYTELLLWADCKFNKDSRCKEYLKYENSSLEVLKDIKKLLEDIQKIEKNVDKKRQDFDFSAAKYETTSVLSISCAVLLRDYFDDLSSEDAELCKDVILYRTGSSLSPHYNYQVGDGTQQAFLVLPIIFEKFESERDSVKLLILLGLFNEYHISMGGRDYFSDFAVGALHLLWDINIDDANSILLGYLFHRPKYSEMIKNVVNDLHKREHYDVRNVASYENYIKDNEESIELIINNRITINDLGDITKIDLSCLCTAFKLVPKEKRTNEHYVICGKIISAFAKALFNTGREDQVDYSIRHRFFEPYTHFILNTPTGMVKSYLTPFVNEFRSCEAAADFFNEFVFMEDLVNSYDNFWIVWNTFKDKIINICLEGDQYRYTSNIVKNYLFAGISWKKDAKDWRSFKHENSHFFNEISQALGHCPSALYAISKLLNDIGSTFINDGVNWISRMVKNNPELIDKELEVNTVYYLENLVRKYIHKNREDIRKSKEKKETVVTILNFLVKKESVVGYILREAIL